MKKKQNLSSRVCSSRALLLATSALLLVFAIACADSPSEPVPSERVPPEPEQAAPGSAEAPRAEAREGTEATTRRPGALGRRPFWHDGELAAALGLDQAQLSIMETRRQAVLETQRDRRQANTELRAKLSAELAEGSWDEARRLTRQLGTEAMASLEADGELKISILEMLTLEQRQRLLRDRPNAFRHSWLLPGARSRSGTNPLLAPRPTPSAGRAG